MEKEWMENEAEKRKTVLEKIMENETRKYNELKRKLKKKMNGKWIWKNEWKIKLKKMNGKSEWKECKWRHEVPS